MTKLGLGKVRALFPIIPSYQKRLCQLLLTQPPPQHLGSDLNSAFATELGNFIVDSPINVWIYGHSHTNIDTTTGHTKIVCNQMGYVFANEYLTNGFDFGKMIEI